MSQWIRMAVVAGAVGLCAVFAASPGKAQEQKQSAAEKLGWRLGAQAYTFRSVSFFESVDKVKALGMKYIEMYPGQKLSPDKPDIKTGHTMDADARALVKKKLADSGVKLVCYGVVGLPADEAGARKVFDFAKEMGIETIVAEPAAANLPMLDKLCGEYGINIAIHNHPKPSPYWNPDTVIKATADCSKRIGSCSDTGHWARSGLVPLECLKKLEGRIVSLHFKDLNEAKPGAHDVPWGTGVCDTKAMLQELKRQGVKAVFSIEYEHDTPELMDNVGKCVAAFNKMAEEIEAGK